MSRQPSKEAKAAWLSRNKHKKSVIDRNWKLRSVYGMTPETFDEMYDSQGGKCAICRGVIEWGTGRRNDLHVDHDHQTRWVRGLLCGGCNLGIGHFYDNPDLLEAAAKYLIDNATPTEFSFSKVPNPRREPSDAQKEATRKHAIGNKYCRGKIPWNKGKPWSEEVRSKMSESAKNRCRKSVEDGK